MAQMSYPQNRAAWVEVNLNSIRKNTRSFKALLSRGTQLMCAVKADAYGHGAVECSKAMLTSGADQLAVATVNEGVELRKAGISAPILLLNEAPLKSVDVLLEYDIMPSIYSADFALAYGERAVAVNKIGRYHLALDTGMSRIGVFPEDVLEFRRMIDFHRGLECAGTFTHFATADLIGDWDFKQQSRRFQESVSVLQDAGYECGLIHCDNTPATVLHPELHFDMVRVGIGLYGLQPAQTTAPRISLEPAMSVRARVMRVAMPAVGEGVGYGLSYRISKPSIQIATVPIGYADGLARVLSNNMDVLVHGERARQVGRICMDQFMFAVDMSGRSILRPATPVEVGDIVTILGRDGDQEITADEMAERRNTINYEVVCNFSQRLERIYT